MTLQEEKAIGRSRLLALQHIKDNFCSDVDHFNVVLEQFTIGKTDIELVYKCNMNGKYTCKIKYDKLTDKFTVNGFKEV